VQIRERVCDDFAFVARIRVFDKILDSQARLVKQTLFSVVKENEQAALSRIRQTKTEVLQKRGGGKPDLDKFGLCKDP
jgi:hypothetical protein